jgi:AraC-like DNA-binding protein
MKKKWTKYRWRGTITFVGQIFLCLSFTLITAQETVWPGNPFSMDSIVMFPQTYERLTVLENEAYDNGNLDRLRNLTDLHIHKAKMENNVIELASGYYYRTIIEPPEQAISYSDSIILATSHMDHPEYPTLGFILKGMVYYEMGDYQNALMNYIMAYDLAVEKKNLDNQLTSSMAIAAIRNINGQPHAAADIYSRSLKQLKKEYDYENRYYGDYILLMYNLSLAHLRLSQLDSSRLYYSSGLQKALSLKDTIEYRDFVLVGAQLDYYEKNYKNARDTLLKYVPFLEGNGKAIKLYYLGKIAQLTGDPSTGIDYFQQIDTIIGITKIPIDNIKEVYQQLILHYSQIMDQEREIESIEKLILYDSLMTTNQKGIIRQATVAYDIPYLKYQKSRAEERVRSKNKWISVLVAITAMATLIGTYFYIRARRTKLKVKQLLKSINTPKISSRTIEKHPSSIPKEIREDLLMKLDVFERSDDFLSKDLDMASLAQAMETNTTYLSTIINHYKQMSFPKYITDLKITAAIQRLSQDPELLKYNYQGLAETFGFKTGESFSKAFRSKTGVYPSKVLAELKNMENDRHL